MPWISAILLAAGESSRMGRQKALLPWHGTTLLEYQLAQLSAVEAIGEIIVVTGPEPERITEIASAHPGAVAAHNAAYRTGKVGSITAALAAVSPQATAILLLAVDQPRPAAILRTVVDAHLGWSSLITVPVRDGRRGHPAIFARSLLP